ncbi:transglycosylase SLT domain-containing protein [Eoetvoesiella caeni]|uniref:Transglycosylase-like protein with SLT domain n=1 Tax=Eoetvoesiella caeni TaxID=645616 RepID=A0A366HBB7_9BURK|nr:transglycosylase SLT domain-containing protein [Eoetvoesiella caeni]NYT56037.1 transglycosylase SLT domain-containing protein [Eoetvoesiella caeni]RBP38801.1 transglycosylase-like protein with SLT domain [Eoetvoesiella caeni]
MLNHDENGFLKGEPIQKDKPRGDPSHPSAALGDEAAQARIIDVWDGMSTDIAAIRTGLERAPKAATPSGRADNPVFTVVVPRGGVQPGGRQGLAAAAGTLSGIARPVSAVAQPVMQGQRPNAVVATPGAAAKPQAQRDASGRFVASGGAGPSDKGEAKAREKSLLDGVVGRVAATVSGVTRNNSQVDPTLQAVGEVAQPVMQGYSALSGALPGGPKRQERWYRRIFGELRLFRKEETAFSKATTRTLKDIEKKPDAEGGGDGGGGFLSMIPVFLAAIIPLVMGLLKKVPVVGGLLSGAMNMFDLFKSESDDSLTRGEKDVRSGKAIGGLGGVLAGGLAGAKLGAAVGALGGPIGIAIGGVVGGAAGMFFGDKAGKILGETVGGWVAQLREADIPGKIVAAWDETTANIRSTWDTAMNKLSEVWAGIKGAAEKALDWAKEKGEAANKWIEEKTGVNVKETAGKAVEAVKDAGNATNEYVKEKTGVDLKESAGKAVDKAKEGASWLGEKASSAKNWISDKATGAFNATAEKLVPGYRHKETFDGIKGGAGLAKNGSYTSAEAERIRELKTSGANTGANLAGGMPADIQQKVRASAEQHGLDPEMMLSIAAMESGGNADAISSTGAIGVFQFTGKTATGVGIKDRFDADQNIEGGMKLTQQNAAILQKRGLPVTPENLYMAHQLGPGAAAEVIAGAQSGKQISELSQGTQKGVGFNYGSSSSTAAEYLAKNKAALDSRYQTAVAGSAAGVLPAVSPDQVAAVTAPAASPVASPVLMAVAPVQTASVPAVTPPSVPAPPVVADAPKVAVPLGSGDNGKPTQVNVPPPDAGQDVRDRRIAHIVTGGLSS